MLREIIRELLVFVGAMTVLVAVLGIGLNWILYRNWYGETEAQRRERVRRERNSAEDGGLPLHHRARTRRSPSP